MKKVTLDYLTLFAVSGGIVLLDQLSKYLVHTYLPLGNVLFPGLWLSQYARIVHLSNTGAALGMLKPLSEVLKVLPFVIALAILYFYPRVPDEVRLIRLGMGLTLGGATGNLIDRFNYGYVLDFISIGRIPVFNVADASITAGAVLIILGLWKQEREKIAEPLT